MNKSNVQPSTPNGAGKHEGIFDQMKQSAGHVAEQAKGQITHRIDEEKGKVGGKLDHVATALRKSGDEVKDVGPLPQLADQAADAIERVAEMVQSKTIGELVGDVEGFARREPAIFLGAAFAIGLLGGRFLKSTSRREEDEGFEEESDDHDEPRGFSEPAGAAQYEQQSLYIGGSGSGAGFAAGSEGGEETSTGNATSTGLGGTGTTTGTGGPTGSNTGGNTGSGGTGSGGFGTGGMGIP